MRVALDVGPLRGEPAGVGVYVASLARALAERLDPEALVLFGGRPDAEGLPAVPTDTRSPRLPYPLWVELAGGRAARRTDAQIAHFTDGLVPVLPGLRTGRSVVTIHDLTLLTAWRTHRIVRSLRVPFMLTAARVAAAVIVPSRATADDVMRHAGTRARKVHVVPLAPRTDLGTTGPEQVAATLQQYHLEPGRYILAVGTLEPRKNHARLIAAFERLVDLAEIGSDMRLVLTGAPGWGAQALHRRIRESPHASRVLVTGYVPPATLGALLLGSGAVAYVSLAEGFGLPVVEALACGAAVVTSSVSAMPEVAGHAAFLVDPRDVNAIANGLRAALDARDRDAAALAARSRTQAARYSWTRTAEETIAVYESVA